MVQLYKFLLVALSVISLNAANLSEDNIKKLIGKTIILGFPTDHLTQKLKNDIDKYNLGGVILFNKDYKTKNIKNIKNPIQLKKLISDIQNYSKYKMLIAIDQEGGKVSRLNSKNGFFDTASAKEISKKNKNIAEKAYTKLAQNLSTLGINLDFAPVVDIEINPDNKVIVAMKRAYSKDEKIVEKYASIFINQMKQENVFSVLKHFPGHGSSKDDSHKGFVDVSNTWQKRELYPYKKLIEKNLADFIMTAHVFNRNLDENYPATLSYKVNTKLLRESLKFKGLIVSDDLQMKAISEHYSLEDTLTLALNSGVNILLFGNQLAYISLEEIVNTTYKLIKEKKVSLEKVIESNKLLEKVIYKKEQQ